MLRVRLLLLLVLAPPALAIGCADDIPVLSSVSQSELEPEVQEDQPGTGDRAKPVFPTPRDPHRPVDNDSPLRRDIYSYHAVRQFADSMLATLAEERLWCDEQPEVSELRELLEDSGRDGVWQTLLTPVAGEDLRAVEIIAEATADARGIPMQELPPVYLVSRTSLRHYACLTDEIWEDPTDEDNDWTVGLPASRLALLLGQEVEDYGDKEQNWLSGTLYWGWYGEIDDASELDPGEDGVGEIVIVSKPRMPAIFVGVISHELVHFLQDQWTGWRLHDWYPGAETTDELQALRWVVEGDATLNELNGEEPPLIELLADIKWGPREHSEYNLWYRAYAALTPQDSDNLFAAYDRGSSVLARLRAGSGQEAIDALLLEPPESSEQLIHQHKLEADEQPIELIDLEQLQAELSRHGQWNEPTIDRMGEQWLNSLIASAGVAVFFSENASVGWGSDQMALWSSQDGNTEVVTWQVVFDDPWQHKEGVAGLRRWFFSHTANEAEATYGNMLSWDGPTGAARLVTRPYAIWLVASNEPAIADEVANSVRKMPWTNYWSSR